MQREEHKMLGLLGNIMYLGGSVVLCTLFLLPALFLLSVSIVYFLFDTIQNFRERRHLF